MYPEGSIIKYVSWVHVIDPEKKIFAGVYDILYGEVLCHSKRCYFIRPLDLPNDPRYYRSVDLHRVLGIDTIKTLKNANTINNSKI